MAKIFFSFAGTGGTAAEEQSNLESFKAFDDDIVRVYFNGCQDHRIGGGIISGWISPDLDVVATGVRQAFTSDDTNSTQLSLQALKKKFGDAIRIEPESALEDDKHQVDAISLNGFSRGAVTTFACARTLNDLDVPISLYAEDPVPGNSRADAERSESQYATNANLSDCHNLKRAVVTVGTYTKTQGGLQNKYFRQMTPKFNHKNTDAHIYTSPKSHHMETDINQINQRLNFLYEHNIFNIQRSLVLRNPNDERFYAIPRVLQQKFHLGTVGRTSILPSYKEKIKNRLDSLTDYMPDNPSFKQGEADLAIYSRYRSAAEIPDELTEANTAASPKGKAVRDFIVETHAIMKFSLETKPSILERLIKYALGDRFEETFSEKNVQKYTEATDNYLRQVDKLLIDFTKKDKPSLDDYRQFEKKVLEQLSVLKNIIPSGSYKVALSSTQLYLKESPLTHPGLTQFLDERETFSSSQPEVTAHVEALDAPAKDAKHLAFKLYVSSGKERKNIINAYQSKLPDLIHTIQDLADIAQFTTPKALGSMLEQKEILSKIKSVDDVCHMMEQLPSYEHRKVLFKALDLQALNPTEQHVEDLNQYLSPHKQHALKDAMSKIREHAHDTHITIAMSTKPLGDTPASTRSNTPIDSDSDQEQEDDNFTPIGRNSL